MMHPPPYLFFELWEGLGDTWKVSILPWGKNNDGFVANIADARCLTERTRSLRLSNMEELSVLSETDRCTCRKLSRRRYHTCLRLGIERCAVTPLAHCDRYMEAEVERSAHAHA